MHSLDEAGNMMGNGQVKGRNNDGQKMKFTGHLASAHHCHHTENACSLRLWYYGGFLPRVRDECRAIAYDHRQKTVVL